jgi:hypothetical protein
MLSDEEHESLVQRFTDISDEAYHKAVQLKETSEKQYRVPKWMYLLLIGLGWNELMWVLRSPYVLIPIIVSLAAFCALGMAGGLPSQFIRAVMQKVGLPTFS